MSVPEVAEYLGLAVATVRRMVNRRDIPSNFNPNWRRRRLVHKRTLDFWIEQHQIKPGSLGHLDSNRWPKQRGA